MASRGDLLQRFAKEELKDEEMFGFLPQRATQDPIQDSLDIPTSNQQEAQPQVVEKPVSKHQVGEEESEKWNQISGENI